MSSDIPKKPSSLAWDSVWIKSFAHYQNDTRHAHYIRSQIKPSEKKILEIAAGSFRDMATLRRLGIDCEGMDSSMESIELAKAQHHKYSSKIHRMDAFNLKVPDKSFDLSFHNGFWGYFSDDQITQLAQEQVRITKGRIIATVHNAHNKNFVSYFNKLKNNDPLYDIRFFLIDEMHELLSKTCTKITIIPVGKAKRLHEDLLIKLKLTHPKLLDWYLLRSKYKYLESSERLLCIGTPKY